jgi:hypothetical protein
MAQAKERTIEDRIRAIEDRLAIYNLIASHPPSADTGQSCIRSIFADDGVLDLGGTALGPRFRGDERWMEHAVRQKWNLRLV